MPARIVLITVILALGLPHSATAATLGEHLEPVDGTLTALEFSAEYDYAVRKTLLRGETDSPYLRMIAKPSFECEWMVEVLRPAYGRAVVRVVTAHGQVWTGKAPEVRRATTARTTIPADLAELLKRTWVLALRKTRYPDSPTNVLDGTTFEFVSFVEGEGNLAGQTCSPPDESVGGRLVASGMMLRGLLKVSGRDLDSSTKELTRHVGTLHDELAPRR